MDKPIVNLWVLGELALRCKWYGQIKNTRVEPEQMRFVEYDSEERVYRLIFRSGAPTHVSAVVLLASFREPISVYQRGLLLLASRFSTQVFVLLCNTKGHPPEELDNEEFELRRQLASLGLPGDDAFFLREPEALPTNETADLFFDHLDQQEALSAPPKKAAPLSISPTEKKAHDLLVAIKGMVLPVAYFTLVRSSLDALYRRPIGTQLGGMPYLEAGEEWPVCQTCSGVPLRFVWQIDAHHDLLPRVKGAGLYTFYTCGDLRHPRDAMEFTIRHYAEPHPSKRQPIREEAKLTFPKTNQPLSACAIKKELDVQLPNSLSLINSDDLFEREIELLEKSGTDTIELYETLSHELCVSQVRFSFTDPTPLQIGGYSDPGEYEFLDNCETCQKRVRTLANIHFAKGMWFPWGFYAFQFFICECSPARVYTTIRSRFAEERLDNDDDDDRYYSGYE
jgi:hypothetical protein